MRARSDEHDRSVSSTAPTQGVEADAAVIAAVRALGLTRIDLLGRSMGGTVAQAVVARELDHLRR